MAFEGFGALPTSAQFGIIAFVIALILLAVAQALSVSSDRSKAQKAAFDALRVEILNLRHDAGIAQALRPPVHGLGPPPRPSKSASIRRSTDTPKQKRRNPVPRRA